MSEVTYDTEIETTTLIVRLRSDGIIETRPNPLWTSTEGIKHARENMKAISEITGDQLRPVMNFLPDHYVTAEAQEYYQKHKPLALASAMVAKTFIQKLVGNFFVTFKRLPIPTRLFQDEDKAVAWLKNHFEVSGRNVA